ncbi:TcaA NTF2-like domain-containing protein [Paenibacillus rigui]|uniref:TcaA protein NTF2-like domain-containing protein n=1 Tax=Paenibacillus rigui TaxID=554312 RepID=A0A229UJP1_9BACL|nr:hypothetical protein [Paenibacillus rigui]OXM83524.1 hypothetical protein CF651_25355 [Paenibacillus rigui]
MSEMELKNQTNETTVKVVTDVSQTEKKTKMKRILILSSLLILLAVGGVTTYAITKNYKYSSLVQNYNKDFEAIEAASSTFKKQVDAPPADKKTLQDVVTFYRELKSKNNFETQVNELNNNIKYASLKAEKKDYNGLGVEKTIAEYNELMKDIDKLQSVMQRSENLDKEIKSLGPSDLENYEYYDKFQDLIRKNSTLKDEVLGVVLSTKLKDAQSTFVDALSYRGKFLSELRDYYNAANSYKNAVEQYDSYIGKIKDFKQQAQKTSSYYSQSTLIKNAYAEADKAEKQIKWMDDKSAEQKSRKSNANSMLAKYNEVMGIQSAEAANPLNIQERSPRPFVGEEKVKIFVEDYLIKGIKALDTNDFSYVESYIDTKGKKYKEQLEYMDYLKNKGIKESLLAVEAKSAEKLDDSSFKVTTFEQYDIFYGDGSRKIKSFTSKYKIVKSGNNGFLVNELLETKETDSIDK